MGKMLSANRQIQLQCFDLSGSILKDPVVFECLSNFVELKRLVLKDCSISKSVCFSSSLSLPFSSFSSFPLLIFFCLIF